MPGTIETKCTTFSATQDAHRMEEFAKRGETNRLSTGTSTPASKTAINGAYIASVVDGWKAWADLRHAGQSLGELTLDQAYEFEFPMVDLLSCNLFGVQDAGAFSGGRELKKAIRVHLSHPVSTFIPPSIREFDSIRHQIEEVDWDARIETLPKRASTEVMIMFEEGAYRSPRIVDDPEA